MLVCSRAKYRFTRTILGNSGIKLKQNFQLSIFPMDLIRMRVVVLVFIFLNISRCDSNEDIRLLSQIKRVRATPDYVKCWLVPEIPQVTLEDSKSFETRLQECEPYYRLFIVRRFSSWGKFASIIRHWTQVIEAEITHNTIDRVREILTKKLINLPRLRSRLELAYTSIIETGSWDKYEKMSLRQTYERGDGICVDLFLPPMDRFWLLTKGLDEIIVNQTEQTMSLFMKEFFHPFNEILIIYLTQHICHQITEANFIMSDVPQDPQFIYQNHLGHERTFLDLIRAWTRHILAGKCEHELIFTMRLLHEFNRIMEYDIYDIRLIHNFKPLSHMLIDNCLKIVTKNWINLERSRHLIGGNLDDVELYEMYKWSRMLMKLVGEAELNSLESWISVIDIRGPHFINPIDRLFFETNDPQLMDVYTKGRGLCSSYNETYRGLEFLRTIDKLMTIRGFRPIHSSSLIGYYLMSKICEQAHLLPLDGP